MSRMVEESREVCGSAVAFEPYAFDGSPRRFAPYCFKDKSGMSFKELGSDSNDYFMEDWFHLPEVLKAPIWTDPYFDEGGARIVMTTCSRPFFERGARGADRKVRGIATADLSLEWLTKLVSSVQVGHTGYCFIISDTGRFVTYPNPEYIMSESMFSLAEELHDPALRAIGLAMVRRGIGFHGNRAGSERRGGFLGLRPYSFARLVPGSSLSQEGVISRVDQPPPKDRPIGRRGADSSAGGKLAGGSIYRSTIAPYGRGYGESRSG